MSLEKIKERILQEAREEAARIVRDAGEKVESAVRAARDAAEGRFKSASEAEKAALLNEEERFTMACKAETNAEVLRLKNQCIDEVFLNAIQEITRLDDRRYLDFIAKLITRNFTKGVDTIVISQRDRNRITKEWLDVLLKKSNREGRLTISTSQEIQGGVILKGPKAEIDCSLEQLLSDKKEELKPEVSKILF